MIIKIHRGAHEIGGSCVQIYSGTNSLVLDLGLALQGETILPKEALSADAVIVSHPHLDHCGLLDQLPMELPFYMGKLGFEMMQASRVFRGESLLARQARTIRAWQEFRVGPFLVKPYLVDHSAVEAFAFHITDGEESLFYTGDFRAHGRKSILFEKLMQHPPQVDWLIMEGTSVNRPPGTFQSEVEVEWACHDLFSKSLHLVAAIFSGANVDRLVSIYRACKRTNRTLVVDLYTAWLLDKVRLVSSKVPHFEWPGLKVLTRKHPASRQYGIIKKNTGYFCDFLQRVYKEKVGMSSG